MIKMCPHQPWSEKKKKRKSFPSLWKNEKYEDSLFKFPSEKPVIQQNCNLIKLVLLCSQLCLPTIIFWCSFRTLPEKAVNRVRVFTTQSNWSNKITKTRENQHSDLTFSKQRKNQTLENKTTWLKDLFKFICLRQLLPWHETSPNVSGNVTSNPIHGQNLPLKYSAVPLPQT